MVFDLLHDNQVDSIVVQQTALNMTNSLVHL